ncbi:ABC transporter ATP-binding protein [Nitratireductor pacificus]|uniref:Oligopeptide/dipeptide ABC transporter ATP-binding protein n=1 Tax=Nitratireductor pacificus pht-3B TaxID=391937 RepID=K2M5T9_9HYPH|nr:ABC transporter ATP-binding protein [Nitratireductor pacificus]EKF17501.1 oligopeptide/dipeptide ABC transporter ATP-binding protein [Nitratireductor pacificus pht-3B]
MSEGPLLDIRGMTVSFRQQRSLTDVVRGAAPRAVQAVQNISLSLERGETLGLVGESGCGKTTLGRAILRLVDYQKGEVFYRGAAVGPLQGNALLSFRRSAQIVFQDPYASLNPRLTVGETLSEVLKVHGLCAPEQRMERVLALLETVGLSQDFVHRKPRQLSGGQCQRVGIARALAVEPEVIIADESVSALDVSIQAQILNLLIDLKEQRNLAMIFISHDLSVVRHVCASLAVMYLGRIVEYGPTEEVFANPRHPYTQALLSARPTMDGSSIRDGSLLAGEPPSPLSLPPGCAFHPRCAKAMSECRTVVPERRGVGTSHDCACLLYP